MVLTAGEWQGFPGASKRSGTCVGANALGDKWLAFLGRTAKASQLSPVVLTTAIKTQPTLVF